MRMSSEPATSAAATSGITSRSGSISVYCTIAAGAMSMAGPIPAQKIVIPSLRSIESGFAVCLACIRHFTTSIGDEMIVAVQ